MQQDVQLLVSSDKGNSSLAAVGLKATTGFLYSSFTKFKNPTGISHLQNTHDVIWSYPQLNSKGVFWVDHGTKEHFLPPSSPPKQKTEPEQCNQWRNNSP